AYLVFFLNDTATTEISTLPLRDALPISSPGNVLVVTDGAEAAVDEGGPVTRSEEHTSELQSHSDLVCRLLLEKKNSKFVDGTGHGIDNAKAGFFGRLPPRTGNRPTE